METKATIEPPGALFRRAKPRSGVSGDKPWMEAFGKLRHLQKGAARIDRIIEEDFGPIKPDDWK